MELDWESVAISRTAALESFDFGAELFFAAAAAIVSLDFKSDPAVAAKARSPAEGYSFVIPKEY